MSDSIWSKWASFRKFLVARPASARSSSPARGARLKVEQLEDRLTPATLDLTTVGSIGMLNGGIFAQNDTQPAGSGVIHSFVRLQAKHNDNGVAQGYNTDARPLQFDEKNSPTFTHSLPLGDVPVVNVNGVPYREFLLDINQTNSTPLLSLDALRLYSANAPDLLGYNSTTHQLAELAGNSPVFDLGNNWIELNNDLAPGSGKANMIALIPDSAFAGGSYVYLYSQFGANVAAHGGYEEWATSSTPVTLPVANLSGLVTSNNGPVSGVVITLTNTTNPSLTFSVQTNDSGVFTFSQVPAGTYNLGESPPSQATGATAGTDGGTVAASNTEIDNITLKAGDNATGYTFTLFKRITG